MISIHALREEGDALPLCGLGRQLVFLSTPSARRATRFVLSPYSPAYISIHALREEGDSRAARLRARNPISIHALREEGDRNPKGSVYAYGTISIHALREEGDATGLSHISTHENFYPRPPRGGRPVAPCWPELLSLISIHALREEGDLPSGSLCQFYQKFLSTPSARRATVPGCAALRSPDISIHALREEGDSGRRRWLSMPYNFYPRPPRGGRPMMPRRRAAPRSFLSTPSARRATI